MSIYVKKLSTPVAPDFWVNNADGFGGSGKVAVRKVATGKAGFNADGFTYNNKVNTNNSATGKRNFNLTAGNTIGGGALGAAVAALAGDTYTQYNTQGTIHCSRDCSRSTGRCGPWNCYNTAVGNSDDEFDFTADKINTGLVNTGKRGFTGDTGRTIDWQVGFEEPPYYGLFGSKKKKTEKAYAESLVEARKEFPTATSCADCMTKMSSIRIRITDTQALVDGGNGVAPRFLAAYNTILEEYIAYYNSNCLTASIPVQAVPPRDPVVTNPLVGVINNDPIGQTALPGVTTPPSQTGTGAITGGSTVNTTANTTTPQSGAAGTIASDTMSKIPKWALYAGGGLILLTGIILLLKKRS